MASESGGELAMSAIMPLSRLAPGKQGRVVQLDSSMSSHFPKIAAFGILPGVEVTVLQTAPVTVVQVGHTCVALDKRIAAAVLVTIE